MSGVSVLFPSFSNGYLSGVAGFVEADGKRHGIRMGASSLLDVAAPGAPQACWHCCDGTPSEEGLLVIYRALKAELMARRIPLVI